MSSGTIIFLALVIGVTILGFVASGWGRANLRQFDEWALGGRKFGTIVSWFLLGGDLYTAYTFVAVPALVYGAGALGFFAVPYATIAYPVVFVLLARFWAVAKRRNYVTSADFVRDRYGDRTLEVVIALTGVIAALPYIALQLIGMKTVFGQIGGVFGAYGGFAALIVAFVILAAYTYTSGLRAPAMIAFVKDTLIYVTVIAAIIVIPAALGGWHNVFTTAQLALAKRPVPSGILLSPGMYFAYATMAFGSCLSLFIYPHSITSILAAKSKFVIQRNAALLPAYSLLLGFLALLGFCAIAAGIVTKDPNAIVPMLFAKYFPDWFAGVANAAIVIGALVPAAIMAIGAANLLSSNVIKQFSPQRPQGETRIAKLLTLVVCAAALLFVIELPVQYAITLQLLGGAWMLQIFPAFALGLYTRWFHPKGLLLGWIAGMATGTGMAYATFLASGKFSAIFPLHLGSLKLIGFIALYALIVNVAVASISTLALNAAKVHSGIDATSAGDYA